MHPDNVAKIAGDLGVSEAEVVSMNRRLSGGDASLNAMISATVRVHGMARLVGR